MSMNELSAEYIKAKDLDRRIKTSAQLAQQSLYDMCMGFKEMRDSKLYKELGYSDFGDYCEQETGFKRRQVYNYIAISEKLPADFVQSTAQIGVQKMYLLTQLPEDQRAELTENTDLENTTVKELEMQIKELKIKADKSDMLSKRLDQMNENCARISSQRDEAENRIRGLEAEIKDLESRPVEVAVHESHEVENLQKAMRELNRQTEEQIAEITNENTQHIISLNRKHKEEMYELRSDYEKRLAEIPQSETVPDTKEVFKAYLSNAVDSVNRLLSYIERHKDEELLVTKTKEFFSAVMTKMEV